MQSRVTKDACAFRPQRLVLLLIVMLTCRVALAAPSESKVSRFSNVVLPAGRSTLLRFQHMKRVEVVEPQLLAVVVKSFDELSLYGKKPGSTVLYVWDKAGAHQVEVAITSESPAQKVAGDLRRVLGSDLSYTAYGDNMVIVEGILPSPQAERASNIISKAQRSDVQVIDLTCSQAENNGAAAMCEALAKVLGNKLQYVAWNRDTVLVQGTLGDQEALERARRLLAAAGNRGIKIVDLLDVNESVGEPPLDQIMAAVGDRYRVWQIQGCTVGVEGTVSCKAELEGLNKVLDSFARQARIVNLVQVVEPKPDVNAAAVLLQQVVGNTLSVHPLDEDSLALEGTVGSDGELKRIREIISGRPVPCKVVDLLRVALPQRRQILCHVRVVEIDKTALKRLGVNWGSISSDGETVTFVDQPWLVQTLPGLTGNPEDGVENVLPIGAQISLLAQKQCAKILSEPNLLVDDGGTASMLVGGEIPIPIAQGTGGGTAITVEWKQFGVQLNVEPQILDDGEKINLKIAPEVSSLDYSNAIMVNGFLMPALRSRKAASVVTVKDGDTLVIGGLLQSEDAQAIRKVPLLGDLPVIGYLFRRKEFIGGQSELVIMVTPKMVSKALNCDAPDAFR
jgi:Flp pilus assembly secretin CpaC